MSAENPTGGEAVFSMVFLVWMILSSVWMIRNPIANPWTCITRIGHVINCDKLAEYQVVETHTSIGGQ